jgi:uncharacterized protein YdeI (YjbR/CyaY-like superfamily)
MAEAISLLTRRIRVCEIASLRSQRQHEAKAVNPIFFETPDDLRRWLAGNHNSATEVWIGFYKKGSGLPSITYAQALDEALCFGWIDGVRYGIDARSFRQRFSPRTAKSNWSQVNIKRAHELMASGRMQPAGLKAFEARPQTAAQYSYENTTQLDEPYAGMLRTNEAAWSFFEAQPPSYRRVASFWVMSAKREETRLKRLQTLIEASEAGRRFGGLVSPSQRSRTS